MATVPCIVWASAALKRSVDNPQIRQRVRPDIQAYLVEHPDYLDQFSELAATYQRFQAREERLKLARNRLQQEINKNLNLEGQAPITDTAVFLARCPMASQRGTIGLAARLETRLTPPLNSDKLYNNCLKR